MHGVKREVDAVKLEAKRREDAVKIVAFREAVRAAEEAREQLGQQSSEEEAVRVLQCSEVVLGMNPGHYTMWNARKEALLLLDVLLRLEDELRLTVKCLQLNPKAYCVWEHRRWCVQLTFAKLPSLIAKETALCEKFHSYDSRNFHCWNYRRWLLNLADGTDAKAKAEADQAYTLKKIREDFSNYSAWQARSVAFGGDFVAEFDLIYNAVYTNPADQSLWMYAYWLMDRTTDLSCIVTLAEHCRELFSLDGEQGSKWVVLTSLRILQRKDVVQYCEKEGKVFPALKNGWQAKELIECLIRMDPMRKAFYESLM